MQGHCYLWINRYIFTFLIDFLNFKLCEFLEKVCIIYLRSQSITSNTNAPLPDNCPREKKNTFTHTFPKREPLETSFLISSDHHGHSNIIAKTKMLSIKRETEIPKEFTQSCPIRRPLAVSISLGMLKSPGAG